jgi:hypothetical protein
MYYSGIYVCVCVRVFVCAQTCVCLIQWLTQEEELTTLLRVVVVVDRVGENDPQRFKTHIHTHTQYTQNGACYSVIVAVFFLNWYGVTEAKDFFFSFSFSDSFFLFLLLFFFFWFCLHFIQSCWLAVCLSLSVLE